MTVNAVAVDAQDNIYVAGSGSATDIPGLDRGFDASPDGVDAFVAKLDRNGTPIWATYLGGRDRSTGSRGVRLIDAARAIAVDAAGQVYIAGVTGADDFPTAGAFQSSRLGDSDGFVAKLSADGRRLLYSSYVGARGESISGEGIAVGAAGEAWIEFWSPQQRWPASHDVSGGTGRVVVLRLNPAGMPVWSTRVGVTTVGGFAVDGAGRAHVSGPSCTTLGNCQQVLLRLDPSGTRAQYTVMFPNRNADVYRSSLALLPEGRVAFTGVASEPLPLRNSWAEPLGCVFAPCGNAFLAIANDSGQLDTVSYLGLGGVTPVATADQYGRITMAIATRGTSHSLTRPLVDRHVDGPIYVSRDRATTWRVDGRATMPGVGITDLTFNWLRNAVYAVGQSIFESNDNATVWRVDSEVILGGTNVWYRIAVDRRRPSVRYGIFGNSVFRHDEGADQWRMIEPNADGTGLYRRTVVVSPHDSSVWIAGNSGVAMSTTGGDAWLDRSAGLPNLHGSSPTVEHLDFDPRRAGVVYALTQVGLYRTADNGASWEHLTTALAPPPSIRAIAFDPIREDTLHAATLNYGLLTSTDAGRTWAGRLEGNRITVVHTDHLKRHIVYAGGSDAEGRSVFYRSIDWGNTWHRAAEGLHLRSEPSRLVVDPRDSLTLYLASSEFQAVPYLMRLQPDAANPHRFTPEFATYLGHGDVRALTTTLSGGLVAALSHAWPASRADQQQIAIVRIAP